MPIGITGAQPVSYADPVEVSVRFDGVRMDIHLNVLLAAPEPAVAAVIHDYDRLGLVFPLVVDSGLRRDFGDGVQRVRAHMEGCVLVFCSRLHHVMDVRRPQRPGAWNSAVSVPGESDVRAGHFSWRTRAEGEGSTRLVFSGWVEPDVWLPPVIGPLAVRRMVERRFAESMPLLEQAAQHLQQ